MHCRESLGIIGILAFSVAVYGSDLGPLHNACSIGPDDNSGQIRLQIGKRDCEGERHCGSSFSTESLSRFTGFTLADLARNGSNLTATLNAEAGTFTCSGTVREGELEGTSEFTPNAAFVEKMDRMGYSGFDSEKLMGYALIGVDSRFVESLKQTGVRGVTVDNLLALRIFNIDPDYIHSITSLGYDMPDADKLIALKVQGVNAQEVREIRTLGYQPTLDELIQIRIFKITPEFIRRMQERGLKNLTIAKLVQIRIFKLDE